MSKREISLVWGESVCVRQAFLMLTNKNSINLSHKDLLDMDYTAFNGNESLILETGKVIKRQTGQEYKHIFLTNGATGGCTIALRAFAGAYSVVTNPAPYFPLYPNMIRASGISRHVTTEEQYKNGEGFNQVILLDTPANPTGDNVSAPKFALSSPVVLDGVYHNNVYMSLSYPMPRHEVLVGSYSKLTGLNGIRLGWIATNDERIADKISYLIAGEYCGLSKPSEIIMAKLLSEYNADEERNWGSFENLARYKLDSNRTEWSKLERYFGGETVSPNGMFFWGEMDQSAKKLFSEAGILWQPGSKCGATDDFGRFNLGQDCALIEQAVKAVKKEDKL